MKLFTFKLEHQILNTYTRIITTEGETEDAAREAAWEILYHEHLPGPSIEFHDNKSTTIYTGGE